MDEEVKINPEEMPAEETTDVEAPEVAVEAPEVVEEEGATDGEAA